LEIADVYFRICGGLKASKVQRSSSRSLPSTEFHWNDERFSNPFVSRTSERQKRL